MCQRGRAMKQMARVALNSASRLTRLDKKPKRRNAFKNNVVQGTR